MMATSDTQPAPRPRPTPIPARRDATPPHQLRREIEICYRQRLTQIADARKEAAVRWREKCREERERRVAERGIRRGVAEDYWPVPGVPDDDCYPFPSGRDIYEHEIHSDERAS